MESPQHSNTPPRKSPRPFKGDRELIAEAAKCLQDRDIMIVEYGQQLMHRIGCPVVLQTVEWIVPDDQLSLASRTLLDHGFPLAPPSELLASRGEWETKALIHNINGEYYRFPMTIHLYPLSFVGLTLEDTVEAISTFDLNQKILTPKPPNYMLSLICYLLKRPVGDINRLKVESDLVCFISYFIFQDSYDYDESQESEEDFQKRVEEAVRSVKSWNWGSTEQKHLDIIEAVIRDCRSIDTLSECHSHFI
ncbi:hypothetical protein DTO282F9_6886 [Paecilomyces variotii]|nr:hypothetical protein DTO282E5_2228 [Paecilomyces variotii]KAJ9396182.1 hypothetical protein DTO282F9_6886 [Paecilomyces variotii]